MRLCSRYLGVSGGMLHGAVPDSSRIVSGATCTCGDCVLKEELEWRRVESRVRRWSSGQDQAGGWTRRGVGGDYEVRRGRRRDAGGENRNTPRENTHTHTRRRNFSVFYRARSSGGEAMLNSTSSPESGASISPDPSRGPPAWAGNRLTSFPARPPQTANTPRSNPMTRYESPTPKPVRESQVNIHRVWTPCLRVN